MVILMIIKDEFINFNKIESIVKKLINSNIPTYYRNIIIKYYRKSFLIFDNNITYLYILLMFINDIYKLDVEEIY